ncbi:MAG TPA: hypothetical protein DC000_07830 [Clostridiales bacterium]|nr:hypothetical protein [Clostridiales bacterium]
MKTKSIMKYYLYELKNSILTFYFIMLQGCIATYIIYKLSDGKVYSTGIELATIIFIFVLGLNLFKSQFLFLIQNGVTRKANFIGFVASTPIVIVFAIIDSFVSVIMHNLIGYESMFNTLYTSSVHGYGLIYILSSILFLTAIYGSFLMLGYFITTLYYAMNKAMKIIVSVGVPVFVLIVLPIIGYFLNIDIEAELENIILSMLGVNGSNNVNILYPIISCVIIYTILSLLTYFITRRVAVKE